MGTDLPELLVDVKILMNVQRCPHRAEEAVKILMDHLGVSAQLVTFSMKMALAVTMSMNVQMEHTTVIRSMKNASTP